MHVEICVACSALSHHAARARIAPLPKEDTVGRIKRIMRIGGVCCVVVGFWCLPLGYGINPERDQSVFNNLADMQAFVRVGLILMVAGAIALAGSRLLPSEIDE